MALTADQITAQNFKDFYAEIRPFLNGNSPLAVNTFNKSDLYDTTEKVIGRWIDGKPLYQKVIHVDSIQVPNKTKYYIDTSALLDKANIVVTSFSGGYYCDLDTNTEQYHNFGYEYIDNNTQYSYTAYYRQAEDAIVLYGSWGNIVPWTIYRVNFVIQYTKKNDTQMSISDGNEYSTSEQLVGHWIDGKPLYQITVVQNLTLPLNSAQVNFGDISGLHIDYGTVVELAFNEDDYWINQSDISIWLRKPNNTFGGRSTLANVSRTGTAYITLRYTKTTD